MLTYWIKTFQFLCFGFKIKEENSFTSSPSKFSAIPLTDSSFIENNGQINFSFVLSAYGLGICT